MEHASQSLGLCFFANQLFYAVGAASESGRVNHIGAFDFNTDITEALSNHSGAHFEGIQQTLKNVKQEYDIEHLRILSPPSRECWTTVPKIVHDNADEREKHIDILMHGVERQKIHPIWYDLSNQAYKFLLLRNHAATQGLMELATTAATTELISDFELGSHWIKHTQPGGSFLTIGCFSNGISVSSFILGKMRGATFVPFDYLHDLPYLWLQSAKELSWMKGLHEKIYVYGSRSFRVIETLEGFWDESTEIIQMDTLEKMNISADESTYSFSLEHAFPAIMLALNYT